MLEINDINEAVIARLRAEWDKDIWEPRTAWIERYNAGTDAPSTERWSREIEKYFRSAGDSWARRLDARKGAIKYRPAKDAWCGVFAGFGLSNPLGIEARLHPDIALYVMPSTYRLNSRPHWEKAGFDKLESLEPHQVRRGDVVTVVTGKNKGYGDHVVTALGPPDHEGDFPTIEGNASGNKPSGSYHRQGVVIRTRNVSDVRRVYRFKTEHFVCTTA